jgi:hypothetical protein
MPCRQDRDRVVTRRSFVLVIGRTSVAAHQPVSAEEEQEDEW